MTGPLRDQSVLVIGRGSGLARAAATYLTHPARGAGRKHTGLPGSVTEVVPAP